MALFFVFIGLYLFGDFRLNDVNVRDYLRQKVTITKILTVKNRLWQLAGKESQSQVKTTTNVQTLQKTPVEAIQEPLDKISQKDKEEILKLLRSEKDE